MRHFPLVAISFCLLASAAAPAFADGGQHKGGDETVQSGGGPHDGAKPQVGSFAVNGASVSGKYLSFSFGANGITGFAVTGTKLFDINITAPPAARPPVARVEGSTIRIEGTTFVFTAHDLPTAPSRLQTEALATITFTPAATLSAGPAGTYVLTAGITTGRVRAEDAQLLGNTLTARGDVLTFLDVARTGIETHRAEVATAIGRGHVGAEATLSSGDAGAGIKQDVVSYGNVTMTTQKLEKGNLTLLVEGHGFDGRVLVLDVDGRVLGAQRASDLDVRLDNVSIQPADNLTDVLDPDNDGLQPEYYVVFDPGAESFQLLVSVPHYSVHTLSVLTSFELPPPTVIVGVVAGVALLVPASYALFRRK